MAWGCRPLEPRAPPSESAHTSKEKRLPLTKRELEAPGQRVMVTPGCGTGELKVPPGRARGPCLEWVAELRSTCVPAPPLVVASSSESSASIQLPPTKPSPDPPSLSNASK